MTIYFVVLLTTGAKLRAFADEQTAVRFSDAWNANKPQQPTIVVANR